jgi:predicted  nucleic acid-binding Zn-ribbon protein
MTWLGKILAVCAMVLALVAMWLMASVYATRTNWQARADQYKKAYDEAKAAREGEYKVYLAEKDALAKQVAAAEAKAAGLSSQVATLDKESKNYSRQIDDLNATVKDADLKAVQLQANFQTTLSELDAVRKRAGALEDEKVRLTVAAEEAKKGQLAAEIAMRQAQAERLLAEARVEDLRNQLADARSGAAGGGLTLTQAEPPIPEGLRGTVEAVEGANLVLSVGFEAGLREGATVDVYRTGTGSRYLGKATVTTTRPKMAVARFQPASGRPLAQLRPDDLPKVGDNVGRVGPGR